MVQLKKVAAVAGGMYMVRGYVRDRLEEVKDRLERERMARESLKRRFQDTQDNTSYTVLALIQTLSEQVLREMDVERLTVELKDRSKARHESRRQLERPPSSLASSIDVVHEQDTRSDTDSAVVSALSTSQHIIEASTESLDTSSLQSWVQSSGSHLLPSENPNEGDEISRMAESIVTTDTSTHTAESSSAADSIQSESAMTSSIISSTSNGMTAAEIWNEVKILTFTRTLTTLYSTTLLSLLTSIQLTLLARSKYIQSLLQQERDQRIQEQLDSELSFSNLLLKQGRGLEDLLAGDMSNFLGREEPAIVEEHISEEVESKFLTISWWLLHVGWKDVGERVRRGVEEVFEGVSLKSKLAAIDLHRLVSDVRRRVEHEVTFEGHERRINFLSSLLPPTPELVQHVLTQGGFTSYPTPGPYDLLEFEDVSTASSQLSHSQHLFPQGPIPPYTQEPEFLALLDETRSIIASSDFAHVFQVSLDRATEVLFDGLQKNVFIQSEPELTPGEPMRIRLAGLLPGLAKWSNLAMNALPNELIDNTLAVREVSCLSAIVFGRFEERFR